MDRKFGFHSRCLLRAMARVVLGLLVGSVMPAAAERLAPGEPIIVAAESARAVIAGVVGTPERLDARTFTASVRVERTLAGAAAEQQSIAWQEPSGRAPRFAAGQRVLLALEAPPRNSLWRQRGLAADILVVAADGNAYTMNPGGRELDRLSAYLELDAAPRREAIGVHRLAEVVEAAQPQLAAAALRRIVEAPAAPDAETIARLAAVAADTQRPQALRAAIVAYFGDRRVAAARAQLAELARSDSGVGIAAIDALAAIDGGLDEATAVRLLADPEAGRRAVGARHAPDSLAERMLPELAKSDPDAGVRAAAAVRLAGTKTVWGLAAAVPSLADPAPEVRSAAALAIARLGEPAIAPLVSEIDRATPAAPGAIAALSLMGSPGRRALERITRESESEQLRDLAALALGKVHHSHD